VVGFGNDFGTNQYQVALNNLALNTNWQKIIIPIPDASKLTAQKGMFYYSAGPDNNGRGYTFWVDNVQFEKLGTISHPNPMILSGVDKSQVSYIGINNTITGFSESFNLPSGINDTLTLTSAYFNFISSNTSTATVTSAGVVSTIGAGTTVITATVAGVKAKGSLTLNSQGNYTHAPNWNIATKSAANVISIFDDAYTNVPVDYFNGYWGGTTTQSADFTLNGDHVLNYTNLNYVGVQFTNPTQNISSMTALHISLFFPTLPSGASFQINVVDFGANGVYGGGDDVAGSYVIPPASLKANSWADLDIPLTSFNGLTTNQHIAQFVFIGNNISNFYADNIYFWGYSATPTTAAAAPTISASNVLSIFSDAYTNVAGTNFFPNWGQSTVVSQIKIAGTSTLQYTNLNYEGTQLASIQDVSAYGYVHLDYYTASGSSLTFNLINSAAATGGAAQLASYNLGVPTNGTWKSVDIPLSAFTSSNSSFSLSKIDQMSFAGGGALYLENIYFWKVPAVPTVAAPTPTFSASSVLSVFSGTYTSIPNTNYFPNWGQANVVSQVSIGGKNTLVYTGLDYEGTYLGSNSAGTNGAPQNVSAYSSLHIDYYSANSTTLNVNLINSGDVTGGNPVQVAKSLTVPTAGVWTSVDIPLSSFSPVDLKKVDQMMFTGNGNIYFGNIYFH
jgi:hypothetical protein